MYASTRVRFEEAYRDIADRLKLPKRHNPKINVLRLVSNWLCDKTNGRWTIVLDNADNVEVFFPKQKSIQDGPSGTISALLAAYLPQSHNGSILITSRNKDTAARLTGSCTNVKEVPAMNKNEGLQLLRNKLDNTPNEDSLASLLSALDHILLAISQGAAYINRRARITVSGYLGEFTRMTRRKRTSSTGMRAISVAI